MFLVFKFMYESDWINITIPQMLVAFAFATSIVWIKTFFFLPYKEVIPGVSAFDSSFISTGGKVEGLKGPTATAEDEEKDKLVDEGSSSRSTPLWREVFSLNYIAANVFFIIMTLRIVSFPSWYYPWLTWTFSGSSESSSQVSSCMDMFGYSYFISLFISPLPGMIIKFIKKCSNRARANKDCFESM